MASRILEVPAVETVETEEEAIANESKSDTFKRLADKRVTSALDKIRLIGNLSARGNYEYTDEQVDKIEDALLAMVEKTMQKFRKNGTDKPTFSL